MRKSLILLCSVLILNIFSFTTSAQDRQTQRQMNIEEFEQQRMEYVKKEVGLTAEEVAKYFPLSRELTRKRLELDRNHRQKVAEMRERGMTDADYRKLLESEAELRRQQEALVQKYDEKFRKIFSYERLYNVQRAERSFMQRELANFRANRERQEQEKQEEN